jgi:hypothetical protein
MDWTIVASVLVALLLWPFVLGSVVALAGLTGATLLRGRIQSFKEQKLAHCKEMFSSWAPGPTPCPCAPSGGGEGDA